jgi:hypothetical protein
MMEYGEPRYPRIEYSARGRLRYEQMNTCYEWLRMKRHKQFLPWGKICFEVMHQNLLHVYPHREREGLQLAHVVLQPSLGPATNTIPATAIRNMQNCLKTEWRASQTDRTAEFSEFGVKLLPGFERAKLA